MSVRRIESNHHVSQAVAQESAKSSEKSTVSGATTALTGNAASASAASRALVAAGAQKTASALTHEAPQNRGAVDLYAWQNKDPKQDGVEGTRTDRAYAELGVRTGTEPIIVAVIDSGVDIHHEDLQGHIWTNPGEIPGNGIDDDHNGYADDIHGWSFLGTTDKNGKPVNIDRVPLVITRELKRLKALEAERDLTPDEQQQLDAVRLTVAAKRTGYVQSIQSYAALRDQVLAELDALEHPKPGDANPHPEVTREALLAALDRYDRMIGALSGQLSTYVDESYDPRAQILGDDPTDYNDRFYGNNDVQGPNARHGTHVAGIIAALRGNALGIDGIASDVRIMALRAVPDGDEYDKDVANAVRYAVDNGAKIINMSFGKPYSPGKSAVDEAFRYAAKKGVLIVHAAGNEHADNDVAPHYPNRQMDNNARRQLRNWIEVGASGPQLAETLPATFSNYGQKSVDLFAPGVQIPSTVPEHDKYEKLSGTSMATPTVSGVAALILSQFPSLSGAELRSLLMETARRHPDLQVRKPAPRTAPPELVPFSSLSVTGGIVDAYEALKAAQARYGVTTEESAVA